MRKPRALRPGDRIAVIAPASRSTDDELAGGVDELRRLGFEPVIDPSIHAPGAFSAGTAQERARAFLEAWTDPSIAAILALRGGYGSAQLLPLLAAHGLTGPPKLFIGYSDNTSLLSWLTTHLQIAGVHGPMIERRLAHGPAAYDESSFMAMLSGDRDVRLEPPGVQVLRAGEARGPLFGGTLTQIAASLGTPYAFAPPPGCILFLEDVNERPYRLHRLLTQLRQAGVFDRAAAILFGEMRGCDEPGGGVTWLDAVTDLVATIDVPVLGAFPSGHTVGPVWTLPLGVSCRVVTSPVPTLIVEESPVE